jgi:Domain of unknown function (DUF1844)
MTDGDQKSVPMQMDFSGLILAFTSAALHYLGEISLDKGEKPVKNLSMAKQNIDILEVLQTKTEGNRTSDETRLLEQALSDLRLKYVKAAKS